MRYLWLFCVAAALGGQTLDLSHFQNGSSSLAGRWKFHAGDEPRWADPNFDDSNWKLVAVPLDLEKQGYPHFSGYGWYRLEVRLDAAIATQDLQLFFGREGGADAYEVYADGNKVGKFGSFPPKESFYNRLPLSFAVPKIQPSHQTRLLIAFRFWVPPRFARFPQKGLTSGPIQIGSASVVQNRVAAEAHRDMLSQLPEALVGGVDLILAVILIAIYSFDQRAEYLFLGLGSATGALFDVVEWLDVQTLSLTNGQYTFAVITLQCLGRLCTIYGIWCLLHKPGRSTRALRWLFVFILFDFAFDFIKHWVRLQGGAATETLFTIGHALSISLFLTTDFFILWWSRKAAPQNRWLAASFIADDLVGVFLEALYLNKALHLVPALVRLVDSDLNNLIPKLNTVPVLSALALGYLLLRRFGAARAEQERLHAEMETARQVQGLMLPSQSISIPDFEIESVYLPAQEVGGDFFQISQARDGSLLMVVGDVSGKGLKAALTVSLLVGLWQDVVDAADQSPSTVLGRLNERLLSRVSEGFVTCLCLNLKTDGSLTIANAGHLAPYLNGREVTSANGLPLGITSDNEYAETNHLLAPEDVLVLISDGVVEARDMAQTLYGFERLQQACAEKLTAQTIASQAQQFGQEDDITVISISRRAIRSEVTPKHVAAPFETGRPASIQQAY